MGVWRSDMQIDDMVAHFVGYETSTLYLKSAVCLRTFALSLALHWRPFFACCDFMLPVFTDSPRSTTCDLVKRTPYFFIEMHHEQIR